MIRKGSPSGGLFVCSRERRRKLFGDQFDFKLVYLFPRPELLGKPAWLLAAPGPRFRRGIRIAIAVATETDSCSTLACRIVLRAARVVAVMR